MKNSDTLFPCQKSDKVFKQPKVGPRGWGIKLGPHKLKKLGSLLGFKGRTRVRGIKLGPLMYIYIKIRTLIDNYKVGQCLG